MWGAQLETLAPLTGVVGAALVVVGSPKLRSLQPVDANEALQNPPSVVESCDSVTQMMRLQHAGA